MRRAVITVTLGALLTSLAGCPGSSQEPEVVRPGTFCSQPGATAVTSDGATVTCNREPGEERYRWRR